MLRATVLVAAIAGLTASSSLESRLAAPPVITVHAKDFAYVGPKTIKPGLTTFRLVNDGKELHHLSIVKLARGKTMADYADALKLHGAPPSWAVDVGGPNPAGPGGVAMATLALDAGEYVMICFIPSPAEKAPHAMKGMINSFTVAGARNKSTARKADVTMRLNDYSFTMSKPLTRGKHVINVVNDAEQPHEVVIVKLNPGKTVGDLANYVEVELMKGPPPGTPAGGMALLSKGRSGTFPVDLTPGTYGLICFVPDAKDGKAHSMHGMQSQFEVR